MASLDALDRFLGELDKGQARLNQAVQSANFEAQQQLQRNLTLAERGLQLDQSGNIVALPSEQNPVLQQGIEVDRAQRQAQFQDRLQFAASIDPTLTLVDGQIGFDRSSPEGLRQEFVSQARQKRSQGIPLSDAEKVAIDTIQAGPAFARTRQGLRDESRRERVEGIQRDEAKDAVFAALRAADQDLADQIAPGGDISGLTIENLQGALIGAVEQKRQLGTQALRQDQAFKDFEASAKAAGVEPFLSPNSDPELLQAASKVLIKDSVKELNTTARTAFNKAAANVVDIQNKIRVLSSLKSRVQKAGSTNTEVGDRVKDLFPEFEAMGTIDAKDEEENRIIDQRLNELRAQFIASANALNLLTDQSPELQPFIENMRSQGLFPRARGR